MPFFEFNQNNSGGSFDFDADAGISVAVIIEAGNAEDANSKAESIGLYFDGKGDCPCCGNRWYRAYDYGDSFPAHYGTPIENVKFGEGLSWKWIKNGPEAYVHYADGRIESFGL